MRKFTPLILIATLAMGAVALADTPDATAEHQLAFSAPTAADPMPAPVLSTTSLEQNRLIANSAIDATNTELARLEVGVRETEAATAELRTITALMRAGYQIDSFDVVLDTGEVATLSRDINDPNSRYVWVRAVDPERVASDPKSLNSTANPFMEHQRHGCIESSFCVKSMEGTNADTHDLNALRI